MNGSAHWVTVEFLGTQPTIFHGAATHIRYTFVPNMRGAIEQADLDGMMATGLFKVKP